MAGLDALGPRSAPARVAWDPALEDVHLNLEAALGERIGPLAGSSTPAGRATTRSPRTCGCGCAAAIDDLDGALLGLERALVGLARAARADAVMPGTTHVQPAQPVLFAHHLLAYVEMLERDRGRFADARGGRTSRRSGRARWPGAGYPLDREATAARARLRRASPRNSIDAVGDRDFVVEVLAAAALAMVHLVAARRGDLVVVEPALRVRAPAGRVLDGLLDDAEQAEPGPGRADPRPRGAA